jgi:hypothetical protein
MIGYVLDMNRALAFLRSFPEKCSLESMPEKVTGSLSEIRWVILAHKAVTEHKNDRVDERWTFKAQMSGHDVAMVVCDPTDEAEHHVLSGRVCQYEPRILPVVRNALVSDRRMN